MYRAECEIYRPTVQGTVQPAQLIDIMQLTPDELRIAGVVDTLWLYEESALILSVPYPSPAILRMARRLVEAAGIAAWVTTLQNLVDQYASESTLYRAVRQAGAVVKEWRQSHG